MERCCPMDSEWQQHSICSQYLTIWNNMLIFSYFLVFLMYEIKQTAHPLYTCSHIRQTEDLTRILKGIITPWRGSIHLLLRLMCFHKSSFSHSSSQATSEQINGQISMGASETKYFLFFYLIG